MKRQIATYNTRLFILKDRDGKTDGSTFGDKATAKQVRDGRNNEKQEGYPFTVSPGPDHHNYRE